MYKIWDKILMSNWLLFLVAATVTFLAIVVGINLNDWMVEMNILFSQWFSSVTMVQ